MTSDERAEWLFLLTPLREGRPERRITVYNARTISTHAPAGGATGNYPVAVGTIVNFYSRPCGRGDPRGGKSNPLSPYFYSRPCGRGDVEAKGGTAPAAHFYSRPCGRGDEEWQNVKT